MNQQYWCAQILNFKSSDFRSYTSERTIQSEKGSKQGPTFLVHESAYCQEGSVGESQERKSSRGDMIVLTGLNAIRLSVERRRHDRS